MSDDLRRRRRIAPGGPRRTSGGGKNYTSWIVTVLAAIAVIFGGWFLGQALAHWFNPKDQQVAQLPTPTPIVTPLPSPTETALTETPSPPPRPTSTAVALATPAATAEPTATVAPTIAPAAAQAKTPVSTPKPTLEPSTPAPTLPPRTTLPVARRPEATTTPVPASPAAEDAATTTVRSYIDALRRGDPQGAAVYLGNGVPDEDFIDENTRVTGVSSTRNSDGSYKVAVNMQTAKGEYYETFVVAPSANGARILDKTAIKP